MCDFAGRFMSGFEVIVGGGGDLNSVKGIPSIVSSNCSRGQGCVFVVVVG